MWGGSFGSSRNSGAGAPGRKIPATIFRLLSSSATYVVPFSMTGLLSPVALFLPGTIHDYAIRQAGPSILSRGDGRHAGGRSARPERPRPLYRGSDDDASARHARPLCRAGSPAAAGRRRRADDVGHADQRARSSDAARHGERAPRARRPALRRPGRHARRAPDRAPPRALLPARVVRPAARAAVPDVRAGGEGVRGRGQDGARGGRAMRHPVSSRRRAAGRRALQTTVIAATLLFAAPAVAGESLDVAWLRGGVAEYIRLVGPAPGEILAAPPAATPLDRRLETALGSLLKLFRYVLPSERGPAAPDYTCDCSAPKDEAFCCAPGSTVGVDQALACSCGLFFAPSRLNVTAEDWRVFWGGRTLPRDAAWLLALSRVGPDTRGSGASPLAALAAVP